VENNWKNFNQRAIVNMQTIVNVHEHRTNRICPYVIEKETLLHYSDTKITMFDYHFEHETYLFSTDNKNIGFVASVFCLN